MSNNIHFYKNDLPDNILIKDSVAIDTETMGLNLNRDRLCLVQMCDAQGNVYIIQFNSKNYNAPNLKKILGDSSILKIFHFGRFDVAALFKAFGILCDNVYCTKIASKLGRTYTRGHGLKMLCADILDVQLDKGEQQSFWGSETLSESQLAYAANDVIYLHELMTRLNKMLEMEDRMAIAKECFKFVPGRAALDVLGWTDDIFAH